MKIGDLVRYKPNRLPFGSSIRGKLYVVTFVFPSGAGVRLGGFPDNQAHNIKALEVVQCK